MMPCIYRFQNEFTRSWKTHEPVYLPLRGFSAHPFIHYQSLRLSSLTLLRSPLSRPIQTQSTHKDAPFLRTLERARVSLCRWYTCSRARAREPAFTRTRVIHVFFVSLLASFHGFLTCVRAQLSLCLSVVVAIALFQALSLSLSLSLACARYTRIVCL